MANLLELQNEDLVARAEQILTAEITAAVESIVLAVSEQPELASACQECYVCGESRIAEVRAFKCGHALCEECVQSQVDHLPKAGQQFSTRNAKCGICSAWIEYDGAPPELAMIKEREDRLLERLKADADPDPELPHLLASGSLLSKWQFMICGDCKETCYAGKMECAPADDQAEASEPWKCINCLDCDQDFPASCEVHGDQHVAFKCFFCCNIATFFCGGKTHFCEQCHKHGWNATPMPIGECRPGCDGRHPDHGTKKIHCLGCVVCRSLGLNFSTKSAQSKQRLAYIKVKKGLPVTAEEAALAAEQIELDRLEEERVAAEKRAEGVRRLMELQLSKAEAEAMLDSHKGNVEAAVSERRQVLQQQAEQRARQAARDAAVETLRSMGFKNTLEQLHSLLSSKNNNLEQVIEALFELQSQQAAEAALKVEALAALGWSKAEAEAALEQNGWDQQAAEAALKVQALEALGWSKAEAEAALEQNGWDQHDAEIALKTDKHWKQCDDDGFSRRLAKKLKKKHFACIASRGAPCRCKPAPCVANPVSPKQSEAALEAHSSQEKIGYHPSVWSAAGRQLDQEEFSGAFAKPRKPNYFHLPNKPMRFNEAKKLLYACYGVDVEKKSEEEEEASEVAVHDGGGEFVVARKKNMRSKKAPKQADASDSDECGLNWSEKSGAQDGDIDVPYIISCGYDDGADNLVEEFSGAFAKPSRGRQ